MYYPAVTPETLNAPDPHGRTVAYSIGIEYGRVSWMGAGADTIEEGRRLFDHHVKFYRDLGEPIREATLTEHCVKCQGTGRLELRTKRTKTYARGDIVTCPVCRGTDCARVIIATYR